MRLFKEKLAWTAPIAVFLIIALFSVNLFAQGDPKIRNLPVAFIVNDEGVHVDNVKSALEKMSKGSGDKEPMIAFTNVKEKNIEQLFQDKHFYAALVIPEGYNDSLENALTNNLPATLKIYINQGFNVTGANYAKNMLNSFIAELNQQYSTNFISQMAGQQIDVNNASVLVNPIVVEEKIFNEVTAATANGSAPTLMAVPAWVGALIGGFIVFLASSKLLTKRIANAETNFKTYG